MPQHTQQSLVYILLLWTTLISIIQVVLITLFFTAGQNGWSLNSSPNSSTVEPNPTMQSKHRSNDGLHLGKGKMLTFTATEASSTITWLSPDPATGVISKSGEILKIRKDGYFFLNLQVTLNVCQNENHSHKMEHAVKLKFDDKVVLEGCINTKTNSTGLLSKVQELYAGGSLVVNIDPPSSCVSTRDSVTHLDIIFMDKP